MTYYENKIFESMGVDDELTEEQEIYAYLSKNNLWVDDIWKEKYDDYVDEIHILINWGDWKHDHARCDSLMNTFGYKFLGADILEEDDSDTYSADRAYVKKADVN